METENDGVESQQFRHLNTRVTSIAANSTPGGNEAARLNKDKRMGPALLLPVVSGDVVQIETRTYFEGGSFSGQLTAGQFLAMVANAFGGVAAGTESQKQIYQNITGATGLTMPASGGSNLPYAHLNYILFDKDYNFLDAGFQPVPSNANGTKRKISFNPKTISEPGYIYVFVSYSNLSGGYVYFDDLKVTHQERLSVVQADDYYPFGMTMAGLEYRRGDIQGNEYLYNGKELQEDHDLNWYDYGARMYDAGLGRWMVVDPLDQFASPYVGMGNMPTMAVDPDGMYSKFGAWWRNGFRMKGLVNSGGEWGIVKNSGIITETGWLDGNSFTFQYNDFYTDFGKFGKGWGDLPFNSPNLMKAYERSLPVLTVVDHAYITGDGSVDGIHFDAATQLSLGMFAAGGISKVASLTRG